MVSFKCKEKGLNKLEKNINKIIKELPQNVEKSVEDILKNIQGYAIKLEKGHNSEGILVEMIETSTMQTKGRIYTDKDKFSWAMLEHFGTGDYKELPAIRKTKYILNTGGSQWFIPVSKVKETLGYPIIEIQGMKFYIANGIHSNHFMTDAEFKTRQENKEIVTKKLNEMLKEACR